MKIVTRKMTDEERMSEQELAFSRLPCWFFRGAYHPEKVSGMDRAMMSVVKKMISGKDSSELTASEAELLAAIETGADYVDKSYIRELVEAVKA